MERTLRGVSYLLCSLMKNQEEYDPPWRTTPDRSGVSYLFPDQEPGGRGPPLKNHPQNWSIFKDLNIRKHWCGNVQKLALTHTHPHRHAWHEHKKREKSQANWNGNFSKPVKFENSPSENNGQDAQNQNFHRVLPLNLIQTIKRRVSLFGQIRQMGLMARRLIVVPRIACRVFGWPTTSFLLGGSRGQ